MYILRRYEMYRDYYCQVVCDDGSIVELNTSRLEPEPKEADWLIMAEALPEPEMLAAETSDMRLSTILAEYRALEPAQQALVDSMLPSLKVAAGDEGSEGAEVLAVKDMSIERVIR